MKTTRTFKVSGLVLLTGALLCAVPAIRPLGIIACVFGIPVFAVSATRHLLRGLLWRVGSRLFVSYLLLVAPVLFVLLFGAAGLFLVAGQLAARRTQTAFEKREAALSALARDLASRFEKTRDTARRDAVFEELRVADLPDLGYLYAVPGAGPEAGGTQASASIAPPAWNPPSNPFLARAKGRIFAAVAERRGNAVLFLTLPFGPPLRRLLEQETGAVIGFHGVVLTDENGPARAGGKGTTFTIDTGAKKTRVTSDPEAKGLEAGETAERGRWITFPLFLQPVLDWESGKPLEGRPLLILTRSSLEIESRVLFGSFTLGRGSRTLETHRIVLSLMKALAILTAVVYLIASIVSGVLVSRIARATGRLSL